MAKDLLNNIISIVLYITAIYGYVRNGTVALTYGRPG